METLINKIENRIFENLTGMERETLQTIRLEYNQSLDWFDESENTDNEFHKDLYWKWSQEHETKAKAMLLAFNMITGRNIEMTDILFGDWESDMYGIRK